VEAAGAPDAQPEEGVDAAAVVDVEEARRRIAAAKAGKPKPKQRHRARGVTTRKLFLPCFLLHCWMERDCEAVLFHAQSLGGGGGEWPVGLDALVRRLRAARVPVAELRVGAAPDSPCSLAQLDVVPCASAEAASAALTEHALRLWSLPAAAVAVLAGPAELGRLLPALAAAGVPAVLLSSSAPPPGVRWACSPSALPRALARASDRLVGAALSPKRWETLLRCGALHPLPRAGLCLLHVDASEAEAPLSLQAPWHLLLTKASDWLQPDGSFARASALRRRRRSSRPASRAAAPARLRLRRARAVPGAALAPGAGAGPRGCGAAFGGVACPAGRRAPRRPRLDPL